MEAIPTAVLDRIREAFPEAQAVWVFGSFATEDAGPGSDLDLAILLPPGFHADVNVLYQLRNTLVATAGREVDLISLREAPSVFANEIVSTGVLLWQSRTRPVEEFEMHVLSLWQKLNEERAGILEDILATGRILSHG